MPSAESGDAFPGVSGSSRSGARRVARVLVRGLRGRCPRCGDGLVFPCRRDLRRALASARTCSVCGWRLERGPGHWVGGSEIHMLVTFPAGLAIFGLLGLVAGLTPWTFGLGSLATVAFSLGFYRPSRCLFFALDYLVDPAADAGAGPAPGDGGDDDGGGEDDDGRRRGRRGLHDPHCGRHSVPRSPHPPPAPATVSAAPAASRDAR